jgi:sulfopyruvate decarboxylase subunit alpha/phosphonopyruvate decarboxylase/sulfopyruvate decarboxylase subunit beta
MNDKPSAVAPRIAEELAKCDVKLVASLPDNWLMDLIDTIDRDRRFTHVRVNREESAVGLCSGAYMGALGSAALMPSDISQISRCYHHTRTFARPMAVLLTRDLLRGSH